MTAEVTLVVSRELLPKSGYRYHATDPRCDGLVVHGATEEEVAGKLEDARKQWHDYDYMIAELVYELHGERFLRCPRCGGPCRLVTTEHSAYVLRNDYGEPHDHITRSRDF